MVEVKILPIGNKTDSYLYVVIAAQFQGKWIWVKHRNRESWEIPGGHIEHGEEPDDAAKRELYEETGSTKFSIKPICDYYVKIGEKEGFSRLYFAKVEEIGKLPESEICCIDFCESIPEKLTYPEIQPILFNEVLKSKDK